MSNLTTTRIQMFSGQNNFCSKMEKRGKNGVKWKRKDCWNFSCFSKKIYSKFKSNSNCGQHQFEFQFNKNNSRKNVDCFGISFIKNETSLKTKKWIQFQLEPEKNDFQREESKIKWKACQTKNLEKNEIEIMQQKKRLSMMTSFFVLAWIFNSNHPVVARNAK